VVHFLRMDEDVLQELRHARAAIDYAQEVRAYHRRRTRPGNIQRESDLALAIDRLKHAMKPFRTRIGKFPYGPQTEQAIETIQAVRKASKELQTERRKLWKMRKPSSD
jgi:anti-sigma-K factor RskA